MLTPLNALTGSLAADALPMQMHWNCDRAALHRDSGVAGEVLGLPRGVPEGWFEQLKTPPDAPLRDELKPL